MTATLIGLHVAHKYKKPLVQLKLGVGVVSLERHKEATEGCMNLPEKKGNARLYVSKAS
jgi:hypothetical protein